MNQNTDTMSPAPRDRAAVRGGNEPCWVSLVHVPSGVASGRTSHFRGNAHTESRSLFVTREQFDTCAEADPLRFTAPILFEQIKREFNHVFDHPNSRDIHDFDS